MFRCIYANEKTANTEYAVLLTEHRNQVQISVVFNFGMKMTFSSANGGKSSLLVLPQVRFM